MKTPKKILIPIDMSTYSLVGVEYGEEIANLFDAEVVLLIVDDNEIPLLMTSTDTHHGETKEESRRLSIIKAVQRLIMNHGLVLRSLKIEVRHGSPAQKIVQTADELHADLIIMSTHGRTGLPHVLVGSIAEKVVRRARCPVLTVKPDEVRELIDLTEEDVAGSLHLN
jgi:nucleotide-binding universal stress UspA family protein